MVASNRAPGGLNTRAVVGRGCAEIAIDVWRFAAYSALMSAVKLSVVCSLLLLACAAPPASAPAPGPGSAPAPAPTKAGAPADPAAVEAAVGELSAKLEAEEAGTFAGLWVEYEPKFHAVVGFTRDGEATLEKHTAGTVLAEPGTIELRTFERTYAGLIATQAAVGEQLAKIGLPVDSMVDVKQNRVELMVTDKPAFDAGLAAAKISLPPEVFVNVTYQPVGDKPPFKVDPDPNVVVPQLRARSNAMMQALMRGTLTLRDGCLRVVGEEPGHLIIWQTDYFVSRNGEELEVLDREGKVVARVGDVVNLGGGNVPLSDQLKGQLKAPVPEKCVGPYWLMGDISRAN